jgi:hypothetical protein
MAPKVESLSNGGKNKRLTQSIKLSAKVNKLGEKTIGPCKKFRWPTKMKTSIRTLDGRFFSKDCFEKPFDHN